MVGMRSVWKLLILALDVRDPNKDDGNEKKRELLLVAVCRDFVKLIRYGQSGSESYMMRRIKLSVFNK